METIIIQSEDSAAIAKIKAFLKEIKVSYETSFEEEESSYDPEFVQMVLDASNEEGGKEVDPKNLWESLKA
jgi:hypothetical protein